MNSTTSLGWHIIAQTELRPLWGRFDNQRPNFNTTHLWLLVSIAALLTAVAIAAYRASQRQKCEFTSDSPRRLFRELCRAHRLGFRSRRSLKRLANARGLSEPATLFVDSSYFDTSSLPERWQPVADEIHLLRDRLFG